MGELGKPVRSTRRSPMQVEVEKDADQRGLYVHPEAFGFDETRNTKHETRSIERDKLQTDADPTR